jgi:hypothetical protein
MRKSRFNDEHIVAIVQLRRQRLTQARIATSLGARVIVIVPPSEIRRILRRDIRDSLR